VIDVGPKQGENLMMRKILLHPEKEVDKEPKHRNTILRMKCKISGKCCNLDIDCGSPEIRCLLKLFKI